MELTQKDKKLIFEYTGGEYREICDFSQLRYDPEQYKPTYLETDEDKKHKLENRELKETVDKLEQMIQQQPVKENHLIRLEQSRRRVMKELAVGTIMNFGIRSATRLKDLADRLANTADFDDYVPKERQHNIDTEYRFITSKSLDISHLSKYPEQQEELVFGSYIVTKTEYIDNVSWNEFEPIYKTYAEVIRDYEIPVTERIARTSGRTVYSFEFRGSKYDCPIDQLNDRKITVDVVMYPRVIGRQVVYLELLEQQKKGSN